MEDEMSYPAPALNRERLVTTLSTVLERAQEALAPFEWRLVGTGAALLHGGDLLTGDVDILVKDRAAVDAFAGALAAFPSLQSPTLLESSPQYFTRFDVDGVKVEMSTVEVAFDQDYSETLGRGPWEHYALLPCGPYLVPTVALELRLITEFRRQRPDRYQPLLAHLAAHGCDLPFVMRGLESAGLPAQTEATVQAEVLAALADAPFRSVPTLG